MSSFNLWIAVLAQEAAPPAAPDNGTTSQFMIYMMGGLVIFMIVQMLFGRPEAKERARREALIGSLKKNDTIVTIGGILGSVVSVSEDKTEVTIRVDDSTRLKMQAAAIREVIKPKEKEKAGE